MKKLLFLPLLFALQASAQHFEIGASGGIMHYTVSPSIGIYSSIITPNVSVRAMYVYGHYQYGIESGYSRISFENTNYTPPLPPGFVQTDIAPIYLYRTAEVPLKVFVNRKLSFKHMEVYAGLFVGYIFCKDESKIILGTGEYQKENYNFLIAGAKIGATYFATKHIGINAEIEAECTDFHFPISPLVKNAFLFPVSLGVCYRF